MVGGQVEGTFDRVSGSTAHMVAIAEVGRPCDGASWEEDGEEEEEEEEEEEVVRWWGGEKGKSM